MSNSVFISYRRSVSSFIARAVFQDLRTHSIDVFMDVESIDAGQFDKIILNQIAARPYFVLILTPGTLDRCLESDDWLRREIEHAMSLQRVIVPLVTPEFKFDDARKYLNASLADQLQRFNAVSMPHDYFEAAMEKLRLRFLKPDNVATIPTPAADESAVQRKLELVANVPLVTTQQLSAQGYFERALARSPDDLDGIIADYDEAIRLNPNYPEAYRNREQAYAHRSELQKAAHMNVPVRTAATSTTYKPSESRPSAQLSLKAPKPHPLIHYLATLLLAIIIGSVVASLASAILFNSETRRLLYLIELFPGAGTIYRINPSLLDNFRVLIMGATIGFEVALVCSTIVSLLDHFILKLPLGSRKFIVRGVVGAVLGSVGTWVFYPNIVYYEVKWTVVLLGLSCGFVGAVGARQLLKLLLLPFTKKWTD